jgi:hypothetical protein
MLAFPGMWEVLAGRWVERCYDADGYGRFSSFGGRGCECGWFWPRLISTHVPLLLERSFDMIDRDVLNDRQLMSRLAQGQELYDAESSDQYLPCIYINPRKRSISIRLPISVPSAASGKAISQQYTDVTVSRSTSHAVWVTEHTSCSNRSIPKPANRLVRRWIALSSIHRRERQRSISGRRQVRHMVPHETFLLTALPSQLQARAVLTNGAEFHQAPDVISRGISVSVPTSEVFRLESPRFGSGRTLNGSHDFIPTEQLAVVGVRYCEAT